MPCGKGRRTGEFSKKSPRGGQLLVTRVVLGKFRVKPGRGEVKKRVQELKPECSITYLVTVFPTYPMYKTLFSSSCGRRFFSRAGEKPNLGGNTGTSRPPGKGSKKAERARKNPGQPGKSCSRPLHGSRGYRRIYINSRHSRKNIE